MKRDSQRWLSRFIFLKIIKLSEKSGDSVESSREILEIVSLFLTNYATPLTYNEFTYQSEGLTGHRGFLCITKYT